MLSDELHEDSIQTCRLEDALWLQDQYAFANSYSQQERLYPSKEGEGNDFQLKLKTATWVPHLFRVSVTPREYMMEKRQRITAITVAPIDFAAESRFLLEDISKMKASQ
ncbi:hypothetical protein RHMOL_Rhmol08G0189900 [Rhododendron molle]|uniref:Uncharacterized protein n=1 Tax=Rhododendron molle TaxID=49168 RepID=A0ACC0MQN8_RHOML|nr:hypothetical protein RHMOL_Rhmol08G0189900 [Rhododendron molle]